MSVLGNTILLNKGAVATNSYSGFVSATNGSSGTSVTATLNTTGTNMIILYVAGLSGTMTCTDTQSNSYTAVTEAHNAGQCVYGRFFYCINPTTNSSCTITVAGTGLGCAGINGQNTVAVWAFNAATTPVVDITTTAVTTASAQNTLQPGSTTPNTGSDLAFFGVATGNGTTPYTLSFPGGWTSVGTQNSPGVYKGSNLAYSVLSGTSAINPTATAGGNSIFVCQMILVK